MTPTTRPRGLPRDNIHAATHPAPIARARPHPPPIDVGTRISELPQRPAADRVRQVPTCHAVCHGWTARPGLVVPQQSPSCAVPTDHRFRANDRQARAPIAQSGQQGRARPCRGIDAPGFHAALLEERELATKHQVLRFERPPGPDREDGQADRIGKQPQSNPGEGNHAPSCRTDSRGPVNPNSQTQSRVPDPIIADHKQPLRRCAGPSARGHSRNRYARDLD